MQRPNRMTTLAAVVVATMLGSAIAAAAALKIDLPKEPPSYRPGPNLELVNARCLICHSADYAATQPPNLPRATWAAEVTKMKKVYGAPIADSEIDILTDYFAQTYGSEGTARKAREN